MIKMSSTVRAEALFASSLKPSDHPDPVQVERAIDACLRTLGVAGCVGAMAQEFGDHPESAVARMRWALTAVDTTADAA
jgi:uncharacterized membrane protein